jgi:hypothetical protein
VEVTASSGSKGGLARLDRASQKWQTWGPESFGLTERVDFDAVYTSEQHDLALINKNLYSLNRQTNVWGLLGVLPDTVYGKLYVANDFAYVISSEAQHLLAADLKGKTLKWQTIPATISNGAGLISDTQLGLWLKTSGTAVTRLVNGTLGESLQLPVIENIGAFAGASGNGVYYHTATGFGRYDLTTGKKNAWVTDPTGQLHSASNRVVTEVNGFVYIAEVDLGGYGGSGEENLYRLDLNDDKGVRQYLFAQSLTDLANPLGVDANGTIYMRQGDKPNAGTVVFDWDKLKFVPSKTAWQPESLALLYDDPASYIDYTPLEVSHKGVKLSVTQPAQGSNILTLTATRSGQPAVTAQVTLKPLLTGAFGYAESVNVYNIRFDDTQADIVWIATDKGLIKFNTASGVNSAYWPGHGGSLTKITHLQPLKDSLILGNDSGAYLYSKKQFQ